MTDISFTAVKTGTVYNVPIRLGMDYFDAKFDTGSSATVIAASVFYEGWSDEELKKLRLFCEEKGCTIREFTSASGHKLSGYPVVAKDILIGETSFREFHYYLIIDGRKEMSLIGDDFIENCKYTHEPHENIDITGFDFDSYCGLREKAMDSDEVIGFIDDLVG